MEYSLNVKYEPVFKIKRNVKSIKLGDLDLDKLGLNNKVIYSQVKQLTKKYLHGVKLKQISPSCITYLEGDKIHRDCYFVFITRLEYSMKSCKIYTETRPRNLLLLVLDEINLIVK